MIGVLEIAFATKSLRRLCECALHADRQLGVGVAHALRRRLADMRAAQNVMELVAGNLRSVEDSSEPRMVVNLGEDADLVFCANHNSNPRRKDGSVDLAKVSRVKLLDIEVYDE